MNCAAVTLTSGGSPSKRAAGVSYSSRPAIFVANVANGCSVAEGGDVVYPDPGPDVVFQSTNPIEPDGNCGPSSSSASFSAAEAAPPPPLAPHPGGGVPVITKGRTRGHFKGRGKGVVSNLEVPEADRPATAPAADTPQGAEVKDEEEDEGPATPQPEPQPELDPAMDVSGTASSPGAPCAQEGVWGCLPGGRTFRRCAAGRWSVAMPVAPGTYCVAGYGADLDIRVL